MMKSTVIGLSITMAAVGAQAAAGVGFDPSFESVAVGQVFEVVLKGMTFDVTRGGAVIDNFTGGQGLNFSFSRATLEVVKVSIDPRWNFGNRTGTISQARGTLTNMWFGVFPATTDDNFNIATITLKALAPGQGVLTLDAGKFVGKVGGIAGITIAPTLGHTSVTVIPEPQQWALLLAGLGVVALGRRRG